jgi:hypothetical protein
MSMYVQAGACPWGLIMKAASWGQFVSQDRKLMALVAGPTLEAVNSYGNNFHVFLWYGYVGVAQSV